MRDANGAFVGLVTEAPGDGGVIITRRLENMLFQLAAGPGGFVDGGPSYVTLFYTSNDCSGQSLIPASGQYGGMIPRVFYVAGGTAYYNAGGGIATTIHSRLSGPVTQSFCAGSGVFVPPDRCCEPMSDLSMYVAPTTFDLSTLGLTPPFHIEGP